MNPRSFGVTRVLAIDPTRKGFGFAVLESPTEFIDWGVKEIRDSLRHRNRRCLEEVSRLIDRHQPDVLVVEHTGAKSCRRRLRARQLIDDVLILASVQNLRTRRVSRRRVQRCFSKTGKATKRQVAVAIALRFPELEPHLPPVRKLWMSEAERMGIFDAVAFALASFQPVHCRRQATASAVN